MTPNEKSEIIIAFGKADYKWLVVSIIIGFIAHYIRALRWNMLIEPLGHKPPVIYTFAAVSIGYISNIIIHRFGEVVRCYTLKKTSNASGTALLGTVITERILDMFLFLIFFVLGLYLFIKQLSEVATGYIYEFIQGFTVNKIILLFAIFFASITGLVIIYRYREKLQNKPITGWFFSIIKKFKDGLFSLQKVKNWFLFIIYTLLMWICYLLMTYVCFFALSETSYLSLEAAFACLAFGTIGIIVIQGGIGIYPFIIAETLMFFGITVTVGYTTGWLIWLSQVLLIFIIGLWAIIFLTFFKKIRLNDIREN